VDVCGKEGEGRVTQEERREHKLNVKTMTDRSLLTLLEESYEPTTVSPPRKRPIHPNPSTTTSVHHSSLKFPSFPAWMSFSLRFAIRLLSEAATTEHQTRHERTTKQSPQRNDLDHHNLATTDTFRHSSMNKTYSLSSLFLESLRNRCREYLEDWGC